MNDKINILLAEDEATLGLIIKESLETRNFHVTHCLDGQEAYKHYNNMKPDAIVLDIMMPKKDGFSFAQEIRKTDKTTPIIFLSAKSQVQDVLDGFHHGGNDYLKKPFSMEELIVRIQGLLDRIPNKNSIDEFNIGIYTFSYTKQILKCEDNIFNLTHREAAVLKLLLEHKNEIVDKSEALLEIWGKDDFFNGRSMDVFISKLRKKLSFDSSIQIINVRGRGYRLIC
ncbi:response regulator transcription factor [Flavobacterium suncheonense]|uniref:Transcriptional regulator n=1 Tax=Flavobacterium suncheonense GH29-5 = DSM 17707 TaxID=1121899 RepID=A0A0A2MDG3_9FLAO|nr:response regulator transcription factor [Flavobacterium suncheonense]KGO86340.1 transcriptional regulator [Flavobacterium suncheonense GH29-5 = DSM 17707]